jgi:endonuclease/exonuclease/phosphatase family metal-dependent hydrolase
LNKIEKILLNAFAYILLIIFFVIGFLWWNIYPPLPTFSQQHIEKLTTADTSTPKNLKIISYNIHYGIGLDWNRNDRVEKKDFYNRLDKIADVLKEIDGDVVLLQEVDFDSSRSHFINQAKYLAKKANYSYFAIAPQIRIKVHPSPQGFHGKITQGLCILSKYEITKNESYVFSYPKTTPFYLRWLFFPHGIQKANIKIANKNISVFNVHLEPWCQFTREEETKRLVNWMYDSDTKIICGGDFNSIPPETTDKKFYHLNDAPWFVDKRSWDHDNEKTISLIRTFDHISEAVSPKDFLTNEKAYYTFPANDPTEKLDYIFASNKAKILYGYVYHRAGILSDHLPIVAIIKY